MGFAHPNPAAPHTQAPPAGFARKNPLLRLPPDPISPHFPMLDTVPFLGETLHRWRVGRSTFLAHTGRGARLMKWNVAHGDGSVRDVIHWPEITTFDGFHSVRGGNPILFPFSARTFDQGDLGFWRADDGVRRPMPMHGFARNGRFTLVRADHSGFAAVLQPDAAAR